MIYKNYIWDLGGTLLDNYESSAHAFVVTLFRHGKIALHDEVYAALKVSTAHAVHTFANDIPGFLQEYKSLEAVSLEKPRLFDGAQEVLAAVIRDGGCNFMISHRDHQVYSILETAGIAKYFTEVVTSDNGFPRKPSPDSINYLIHKYQLTNAVMIGDRPIDIEAGNAAHISTVFFDPELKENEATRNIKSLRELL
ncbi:MAG: HAD-IA family hydrolase [Streptococcaceae bacterium]|jgi:HAD superfamily hydrolase (TIGR01549 family)|nr:HAD-IA family hydrolase [Streptococcaceae bacterium]